MPEYFDIVVKAFNFIFLGLVLLKILVFDSKVLGPRYSAVHIAACCRLQTAAGQDLKTDQKPAKHLAEGDFESVAKALSSPGGLRDVDAKKESDFLFDLFSKFHDHSSNDFLRKKKRRKRQRVS